MDRRLSAILAVDVVGFATHNERDEVGVFERLRAHRKELFEPEITKHHGRIFKLMGDGLLAEFASVVEAVECAVTLQRAMAERNNGLEEDQRIEVRIGINLGDVIIEDEDRHGEGVIIAARLQQLAEPGGIVISRTVIEHVTHKLALHFEPLGQHRVKNITEPIDIYRVIFDDTPPRNKPPKHHARRAWMVASGVLMLLVIGAGLAWHFLEPMSLLAASANRSPSGTMVSGTMASGTMASGTIVSNPNQDTSKSPTASDQRVSLSAAQLAEPTAPSPDQVIADQGIPVIIVLPFQDLSAGQTSGDLGRGIAEQLTSLLATFPDFEVISSTSSLAYSGKSIPEVVKATGARFVIEGSVRLTGATALITLQLIGGTTDRHLSVVQIEEKMTDPVTLQVTAARRLDDALGGITGTLHKENERIAWSRSASDLKEYDYYIRGHTYHLKGNSLPARQIWREGLERFPNSVLLHCKLAFGYGIRDVKQAARLVMEAGRLEKRSRLDEWYFHWVSAWIHEWRGDHDRAAVEAKATIQMAPYDTLSRADLSEIFVKLGDYDTARDWITFAVMHDPAPKKWYFASFTGIYDRAGRSAEALEIAEAQIHRPAPNIHWYEVLASAYQATGQPDKAEETMELLHSLPYPLDD